MHENIKPNEAMSGDQPSLEELANEYPELAAEVERLDENVKEIALVEQEVVDEEEREKRKKELKKALKTAKDALVSAIISIGVEKIVGIIAIAAFDNEASPNPELTQKILAQKEASEYVDEQIDKLSTSYGLSYDVEFQEAA